jgi:hypothetical protein
VQQIPLLRLCCLIKGERILKKEKIRIIRLQTPEGRIFLPATYKGTDTVAIQENRFPQGVNGQRRPGISLRKRIKHHRKVILLVEKIVIGCLRENERYA